MSKISSKRKVYIPDIFEMLPTREYHCEFDCGKVFKNRTPYEVHLHRMHGVDRQPNMWRSFRCPADNCKYFGKRLVLVRRHYQNHHMQKNYNCDKCDRKFIVESQFSKHSDRCEVQQYPCPRCPRSFRLLSQRNRHVRQCVKNKENVLPDCKPVANLHPMDDITGNKNVKLTDDIFIKEFEELLRNIENKTIEDPDLINELAAVTPTLQVLQSE
ncbi:hypothetical protein ACLKA7_014990 [Drosophila subpalustris]